MEPSTCASPRAPLRESERTRRRPLPTCHRYHTPSPCASLASSATSSSSSSSPVACSGRRGAWWMVVVVVGLMQCPRGAWGFFTPWHRMFVHRTYNHHHHQHQQQQQGPAAAPSPLAAPAPPPARPFGSFFRPLSLQLQSFASPFVLAASRVPTAVGRSKSDGISKKRGRKPKAALSASSSTRATSDAPPSSLSSSSSSSSSSSASSSLHDACPADPIVLSASRVPSAVGTSLVDSSSNSSSKKRAGRRPKAASASSSARATSNPSSPSPPPSSSSTMASYPPHVDAMTLSASRVPSAVGRSQSGGDGGSSKKRGRKPRSASASSSTKATEASSSSAYRNDTMASPTSMYATAGVLERPATAAPAKPRVGRGEEPPPPSTEEANPFDGEDSGGYMEGSMSAKQLRNYIDEERDASAYAGEGLASKPENVVAIPQPEVLPAPVPVAAKKKPRASRKTLVEPDWTVKTEDDVCRATINVISTGDESDLAMITPFVERLLTRYGDRIEILHRPFVPEDKPGIRLLEIWFEGFECFQLYSRYQYLKRGKRGELTPDLIDEMCEKIDWAMYLDATGDYGPAL